MRGARAFAALLAIGPVPARATDPAAAPAAEAEHTVQPGETLGGIAARARVQRVLIIEANGLQPPYTVKAGQKLVIPRRRSHTVAPGQTAFGIAFDYGVPWAAIAAANGLKAEAPVRPGQQLVIPTLTRLPAADPEPAGAAAAPAGPPARFGWPLAAAGEVRRGFAARGGERPFHDGIDILADKGTPVRASAAGTVIFAGDGPAAYGRTVIIHHGAQWTTVYSYLDRITVKPGDRVRAGQPIGRVGADGQAQRPQLHFEVRRSREAIDPAQYLPAGAQADKRKTAPTSR